MKTLEQLETELHEAKALCERYAQPTHMVRNCPSDLQARDMAWRKRQALEYQIAELKKELKITVDFCLILDK
jgi:hypothetical protein